MKTENDFNFIIGRSLVACKFVDETSAHREFPSVQAETGNKLQTFLQATSEQVNIACELAGAAFRETPYLSTEQKIKLLTDCAEEIQGVRDQAINCYTAESGLDTNRANVEFDRMVNQAKSFARHLATELHLLATLSVTADGKVACRKMRAPIGPVVIFGASNFPFAYSAGSGDWASAFAAGCPVISRANESHPMTAEVVGQAISKAVLKNNIHPGFFSVIQGDERWIGQALVEHQEIVAGCFTGSPAGGKALAELSAKHGKFWYAEMSSVNPVFVMPEYLTQNPEQLAEAHYGSLVMGCGQFCTNPGIIVLIKSTASDKYLETIVAKASQGAVAGVMLTQQMAKNYYTTVKKVSSFSGIEVVSKWVQPEETRIPKNAFPVILKTTADNFVKNQEMQQEVFGPCTLVVECRTENEMYQVATKLEGQLTAPIFGTDQELLSPFGKMLFQQLQRIAGRIPVRQMPTGVLPVAAMHHGGPYPSTFCTATSVGFDAMDRLLKWTCFDGNYPEALIPQELHSENPLGIVRRMEIMGKTALEVTKEAVATYLERVSR